MNSTKEELKQKYNSSIFNINDEHPRTTLTGIIFAYVRAEQLFEIINNDGKEKRLIKINKPLKDLFGVNDEDIKEFKNFQKYMSSLYV